MQAWQTYNTAHDAAEYVECECGYFCCRIECERAGSQEARRERKNEVDKYEPPYQLDRLPKHLHDDPVHRWRSETGIELVHEEPSWEEYQRIQRNWQLMTEEQKAISDAKAIELFGVDNMTLARRIRLKMFLKRLGI